MVKGIRGICTITRTGHSTYQQCAVMSYSQRHRIMMLVPKTLREVAVDKFVLIISAVYVVHALCGLV